MRARGTSKLRGLSRSGILLQSLRGWRLGPGERNWGEGRPGRDHGPGVPGGHSAAPWQGSLESSMLLPRAVVQQNPLGLGDGPLSTERAFSQPRPVASTCRLPLHITLRPLCQLGFTTPLPARTGCPALSRTQLACSPGRFPRPCPPATPVSVPPLQARPNERHARANGDPPSTGCYPGRKGRGWGLALKSLPNSSHDNQPRRAVLRCVRVLWGTHAPRPFCALGTN